MAKKKQQRRAEQVEERSRTRPTQLAQEDQAAVAAHQAWHLIQAAAGWVTDPREHEELLDELVFLIGALPPEQSGFVEDLITGKLVEALAELYERGWQPADLRHLVHRSSTSAKVRALFELALSWQFAAARHPVGTVPPAWLAQLSTAVDPNRPLTTLSGQNRWEHWESVVRGFAALHGLPSLEQLLPAPSQWSRTTVRVSGRATDNPQLARVRALLAKAESTDFPDEAEALTGKAQELMAKYAIDEVLIGAATAGPAEITGRRLHLEEPYAHEKATLASVCVSAQHGKAIWDQRFAIVTLVGTPGDLDLTELLFTSLLVQAVRAMDEVARTNRAESRRPSFRRAFLTAYAHRIADRLDAATARATRESGHGTELVPLFARRTAEVSAEFDRLFPRSTPGKARSFDAAGWHAGSAAADRATLASGRPD